MLNTEFQILIKGDYFINSWEIVHSVFFKSFCFFFSLSNRSHESIYIAFYSTRFCGHGEDPSVFYSAIQLRVFLSLRWNEEGEEGWRLRSGFHQTNIFIISHSWHRRPWRITHPPVSALNYAHPRASETTQRSIHWAAHWEESMAPTCHTASCKTSLRLNE